MCIHIYILIYIYMYIHCMSDMSRSFLWSESLIHAHMAVCCNDDVLCCFCAAAYYRAVLLQHVAK